MKVSVIVPAFNAEATLEAAVNSLIATDYPALEILVVDDGSCDTSLAVAQGLVLQHPGSVRLLAHDGGAHRGVSASRNLGIRNSSGDLIAFLDADDLVLPHRFQTSVAMLREQPDLDGVYELTRIVNRSEHSQSVDAPWPDGATFGMADPYYGQDLLWKLMTGIPWHGNAFLCRRDLFHRIGLFDEARVMAEDCHLWIRAAAAAKIVPANPLTVVCLYVRHGANSYQYSFERRLDLLDAMADAGSWIKLHAASRWSLWRRGFTLYFIRCMNAAQETGCQNNQYKQIRLCFRNRLFFLLLDWRIWRLLLNVFRIYLGSPLLARR